MKAETENRLSAVHKTFSGLLSKKRLQKKAGSSLSSSLYGVCFSINSTMPPSLGSLVKVGFAERGRPGAQRQDPRPVTWTQGSSLLRFKFTVVQSLSPITTCHHDQPGQ